MFSVIERVIKISIFMTLVVSLILNSGEVFVLSGKKKTNQNGMLVRTPLGNSVESVLTFFNFYRMLKVQRAEQHTSTCKCLKVLFDRNNQQQHGTVMRLYSSYIS